MLAGVPVVFIGDLSFSPANFSFEALDLFPLYIYYFHLKLMFIITVCLDTQKMRLKLMVFYWLEI